MTTYTTKEGDRIDQIAVEHYGHVDGTVELILDQNKDLALQLGELPEGLVITIPDAPQREKKAVRLWG